MKAEKMREFKAIYQTLGFQDSELAQLEQYVQIGIAVEAAFENQQFCIAAWKHPSLMTFKDTNELLQWHRERTEVRA